MSTLDRRCCARRAPPTGMTRTPRAFLAPSEPLHGEMNVGLRALSLVDARIQPTRWPCSSRPRRVGVHRPPVGSSRDAPEDGEHRRLSASWSTSPISRGAERQLDWYSRVSSSARESRAPSRRSPPGFRVRTIAGRGMLRRLSRGIQHRLVGFCSPLTKLVINWIITSIRAVP